MTSYTNPNGGNGLSATYNKSNYPSFFPMNPTGGNSAAVALSTTGFYTIDSSKLFFSFTDAFVEFKAVTSGNSAIPYLPPAFFSGRRLKTGSSCPSPGVAAQIEAIPQYDFSPQRRLAWIWFTHGGGPNQIWLGGATQAAQLGSCTTCSGNKIRPLPQVFGSASWEQKTAFINSGSIEAVFCTANPTQQINATQDTTNHETGHIFGRVPVPGSVPQQIEHDDWCEWIHDGRKLCSDPAVTCTNSVDNGCLMNTNRSVYNKLHRFDRFDLVCGDTSIRSLDVLQGVEP